MSQRLNEMKWFWCFLVFYSGSAWNPVKAAPNPQNRPSTIESQAKFFQDFFSVQLSPYKIEFGHVCEDPNTWEQRYERKDYKNHRDMGKVRWGDKKGGYGEHYWDLNHAGHTDDHDNGDYDSDGQYNHDTYDEPSELSPSYESSEKQTYDESERIKRADFEKARKEIETPRGQYDQAHYANENGGEFSKKQKKPREKHHIVLVVNQREREPNRQKDMKQFVPYESRLGVRRHQNLESSVAASAPRLFFESSTGHVIDRTTGQAYMLQPVIINH
ncbi:uncharacterized protein LOC119831527 isoform X1 [Zerene cesonia]|uniref:uncharacterized protein LOC119831527 isoform X1 n=1 Tax=Zerene cesonia TaxID=33412 RepID=UPI0018E59DF9|nr:uncharacterized protein LOC119831527 isoform X1 [Zerene cesonia]